MKQSIIRIDLGGVNCYLGKQGDHLILFDTGGHMVIDKKFTNRRDVLEDALKKQGCTPENLKLIVLTHGDNDHVANAAYLKKEYQTPIAMHRDDLELVVNPTLQKVLQSFRYRSMVLKLMFKLLKRLIIKISTKTLDDFESFEPDIYLNHGDTLTEYGFEARIVHMPGHTKGSIGIITSEGALIAGDTLANMKKPARAPNAQDFDALDKSIIDMIKMNITKVYPGHGLPFDMTKVTRI
ncbi:MBL fold metallo-hydrolase [Vallitalea pronyensis]|uniref:MBL fold metallo-hydrolase n=1 Tax=Vallitalea pronyensis TaxID=1348613 RepID=A0A8J8MLW3_9FIRM|nr:MBL fold metallo-hydrolase [Vallitalea pronyensis]QUI23703.1 MBL fold metallo-hydrolase [Vallitalea pronyensis]